MKTLSRRSRTSPASVIQTKINRLQSGGRPRVIDLFAGCGGLSLGFHGAGFQLLGAVERDRFAVSSYARNFHSASSAPSGVHDRPRDILSTPPDRLMDELDLGSPSSAIDVLVGGPPCQAYARVGRAKLREVMSHPTAFRVDPRSNLYLRYLDYVRVLRPVALLMENVPDILNHGGHNVAEEMSETLEDLGYVAKYTLLNSVYYGVPQMRDRVFLIAYARELSRSPAFPSPTHYISLPPGYEGSRQVALQGVLGISESHFTPPTFPDVTLPEAVTAEEALSDLPPITGHLTGDIRRGARRFTDRVPYRAETRLSDFARLMRTWPSFEANGGIVDHVIRSLPRDYAIFRRMRPGDQYPEAYSVALDLFNARLKSASRRGADVSPGSQEHERLQRQTVPPYDPGKFPNKWRKMESDRPARTLMAHLGKDSYSHIHYDSQQARTISVREAARLQSFPDGFVFSGTMNPAFTQIGNAVPPVLARELAREMMRTLRDGCQP